MKEDWLNESIRNKYRELDFSQDVDRQWERFQAKRKRKKRRALWLVVGIFLLVFTAGWAYLYTEVTTPFDRGTNVVENKTRNLEPIESGMDSMSSHIPSLTTIKKTAVDIPKRIASAINDHSSTDQIRVDSTHSAHYPDKLNAEKPIDIQVVRIHEFAFLECVAPNLDFLPNTQTLPDLNFTSLESVDPPNNNAQWAVGIDFSYGFLYSKTSSLSDPLNGYAAELNALEEAYDAISIGVHANKYFNPRIFLQFGIGYYKNNIKFRAEWDTTFMHKDHDVVIERVVFQNGEPDSLVYGTVVSQSRLSEKARLWQHYKSFSIPVSIGYQWPVTDKLNLNVQVGGRFSFNQMVSAQTLAREPGIFLTPISDSDVRTVGLFSLSTAIYVNWSIGEKLSVFSGFEWERDMNNRFLDSYGILHKQSATRMKLGIQRHW